MSKYIDPHPQESRFEASDFINYVQGQMGNFSNFEIQKMLTIST